MLDFLSPYLPYVGIASAVVAGASLALKGIAKHTKNKKDDEIAGWLDKLTGLLSKVSLNVEAPKRKVRSKRVVDHRKKVTRTGR